MTFRDIIHFAFLNLKLRVWRTILTVMGVIIGIAALFFFISLTEGIHTAVFKEINKSYADNQIIVNNDYVKLGIVKVKKEAQQPLNDELIAKFKNIDGVKSVYPVLNINLPATIRVDLFDVNFESDIPIFAMSPEIFKDKPELYKNFTATGSKMPGILNSKIIDYYNTAFAESYGWPSLDESIAINREFILTMGYSLALNSKTGTPQDIKSIGAGMSDRVPVMGLTIPLYWAEKIKQQFPQLNESENIYNLVYIDVENSTYLSAVSKIIDDLGFRTTSGKKIQEDINGIISNIVIIFGVISLVILIVSTLSIANTISMSVLTRSQEIGILRSCGSTRTIIYKMFLTESFLIGLIGGIIGIILGLITSIFTNFYFLQITPDLTFKPDTYFLYPWWTFAGSLFIAILLSVLAGIIPSRQATKLAPIQALMLH